MPVNFVSKTPISIPLPDGSYCALYNDVVGGYDVKYYQDKENKDLYTKLITTEMQNYRGLVYQIYQEKLVYNPNLSLVVPCLDGNQNEENEDTYMTSNPLFECISPMATYVDQKGIATILFWTNLKPGTTFKDSTGNQLTYDPEKILKIKNNEINSFSFEENTISRALCTVTVEFVYLYTKYNVATNSENSTANSKRLLVPIARNVTVLKQIDATSPVLDFNISGNNASATLSRHAHINNHDAGFAFAVFHPGTSVPLGNPWKN